MRLSQIVATRPNLARYNDHLLHVSFQKISVAMSRATKHVKASEFCPITPIRAGDRYGNKGERNALVN